MLDVRRNQLLLTSHIQYLTSVLLIMPDTDKVHYVFELFIIVVHVGFRDGVCCRFVESRMMVVVAVWMQRGWMMIVIVHLLRRRAVSIVVIESEGTVFDVAVLMHGISVQSVVVQDGVVLAVWGGSGVVVVTVVNVSWRLLVVMWVVLEEARRAVRKFFAHLFGNIAEINKVVCHVNQLRRGVGTKARDFDATTFVCDSVDGIDEIFVARDEHRRVVATGETEHVDSNLNVEICFARAVVKSFQFFVYDAKTVAAHPEQKALLPLSSYVHACVKESAQQTTVAQQDAQKFVVINV
jgi:hypothetical protein